jgi:hypothetical protein
VTRAERPRPLDELKEDTVAAVLRGPGTTPPALRLAVSRGEPPEELRALVEKIRRHAYKVTDEDFAELRTRYTEDQLFEIVLATVLGAAGDRLGAGLRALDDA